MNGYKTNDCGVVMNADVVFRFMPKNALAWLYWEIKVGICDNNLWDNGYSHGGGGSPCCIGRWNTKEEAIKDAILIFKEHFKKFNGKGMYKKTDFMEAKTHFYLFANKTHLSNESQTKHIKHIADNGSNYVQASLF